MQYVANVAVTALATFGRAAELMMLRMTVWIMVDVGRLDQWLKAWKNEMNGHLPLHRNML